MHRDMAARAAGLALIAFAAAVLAGCVEVPTIPDRIEPESGQVIRVRGSHGPLSRRETAALLKRLDEQVGDSNALDRHLAIEQAVTGSPLYAGNRVTILRDGPQTFAAMAAAIGRAQHFLYLEYYTLEDVDLDGESLGQLLLARRDAGVQIDIIYDSIGSLGTPGSFFAQLRDAGIHVRAFNPLNPLSAHFSLNDRDHRKLLIADNGLAIIGGVNLSTAYRSAGPSSTPISGPAPTGEDGLGRWHDTDLQIEGPAVLELKGLFEQHWVQQGGSSSELTHDSDPPLPPGNQVVRIIGSEGGETMPHYYATVVSAIRSASERIWITAAYFVPTWQETRALMRAARQGIDVRLLLPARSDSGPALAAQRSHYSELLRAGVKIFERDDGMLHSKTMVLDGVWSIVGSSNFDQRSVLFNDEVDAVVIGASTGSQLERLFEQGCEHAQRIELASWKRRPFVDKVKEQFWRLWQELL
jgi:cardiolipin synthase